MKMNKGKRQRKQHMERKGKKEDTEEHKGSKGQNWRGKERKEGDGGRMNMC